MRKKIAQATLACGLLLVGSTSAEAPPQAPDHAVALTPGRQNEMRQDFQRLKRYWTHRGIGLGALRLTFLIGSEGAICRNDGSGGVFTSTTPDDAFCADEQSVVVTDQFTHWVDSRIAEYNMPPHAADILILAHEVGHAVQKSLGLLRPTETFAEQKPQELQADCYAGEAVEHLDRYTADYALDLYLALGSSPSHGSSLERLGSFNKPMDGDSC